MTNTENFKGPPRAVKAREAAHALAELVEREIGAEVTADQVRFLFSKRHRRLSVLAHAIMHHDELGETQGQEPDIVTDKQVEHFENCAKDNRIVLGTVDEYDNDMARIKNIDHELQKWKHEQDRVRSLRLERKELMNKWFLV